jgi:multiple sugar transport system ATP-binding protein
MHSVVAPYLGKEVIFGIRPEDIYDKLFHSTERTKEGTWTKATVDMVEPMGSENYLYLRTEKNNFVARVEPNNTAESGQVIEIVVDMGRIHLFDPATQKTII